MAWGQKWAPTLKNIAEGRGFIVEGGEPVGWIEVAGSECGGWERRRGGGLHS